MNIWKPPHGKPHGIPGGDQLKHTEWCIRHCSPRLGSDFIATARGLLTDTIRSDLKNLKEFRFTGHPDILIEPERIDRLNAILQSQLDKVLA